MRCLAALCSLIILVQAKRVVPEKIITVTGRLDDLVARKAAARPEAWAGIIQHEIQSRINVHGDTYALEKILKDSGYEYAVEHNHEIVIQHDIVAPWNLDYLDSRRLALDEVYSPPATGSGIPIYNLDLGVNCDHVEFGGRCRRDPVWKDEAPCNNSHGTWTAVISSGEHYGTAPGSILWDIKLPTGSDCTFYVSDALDAFQYLLTRPAPFIVSMSWKAGVSPSINELCAQLRQHGAVLVAAAGNDATNNGACDISPASSNSTLSVASVDKNYVRSDFSNYGGCIDVFAPGRQIWGGSSFSNTNLVRGDGTSASCPHVAGVAAVLMQAYHLSDPSQIEAKIKALAVTGMVQQGGTAPNRLLSVAPLSSSPSPAASSPETALTVFLFALVL